MLKLLAKPFFQLQLDFAHALTEHWKVSLPEALFTNTSLYTRLIGYSELNSPTPDNSRWQQIIQNLPQQREQQLNYIYNCYLDYEQHKPSEIAEGQQFGCFSYTYNPDKNKFSLHFHNADPRGNLSKERIQQRLQEFTQLFTAMKQENRPEILVGVTSWLLQIEAFTRLLPPAFVATKRLRNKGSTPDNGWWGQFIDKHGNYKEDLGNQMRLAMKQKKESVDDYFPLKTMRAEAAQEVFYEFYGV